MTLNIADGFGLEGEINVFPQEARQFRDPRPFYVDSRRTQGLFGVKTGMRSEKAGIFGKLRPGFVHFSESRSIRRFDSAGIHRQQAQPSSRSISAEFLNYILRGRSQYALTWETRSFARRSGF